MIKVQNQVPSVYPNISRDFQYISWLFNIVLNSVKHNVDDMYELPKSKDQKLTELLALTLGFKIRRNYDQAQLAAIVNALPVLLRYKGTEKALQIAGESLIKASGTTGQFKINVLDNGVLEIIIPKDILDITLFIDLLPYIAPAGMTCKISRKNEVHGTYITEVTYEDRIEAKWFKDLTFDGIEKVKASEAPMLFEPGTKDNIDFSNIINDEVNVGLLNTSIIPVLESSDFVKQENLIEEDEEQNYEK